MDARRKKLRTGARKSLGRVRDRRWKSRALAGEYEKLEDDGALERVIPRGARELSKHAKERFEDVPGLKGPVAAVYGNRCLVLTAEGEVKCALRGKFLTRDTEDRTPLAVGDEVTISVLAPGEGAVEAVKGREKCLYRRDARVSRFAHVIAANVDAVAVVASIRNPEIKVGLVDRYLLACEIEGIEPMLVIAKADLGREEEIEDFRRLYSSAGVRPLVTSIIDGRGLDELREAIAERRTVFAGHSGVGKTSLLNALKPGLGLKVAENSFAFRGRHTTELSRLVPLDERTQLIDTPGVREFALHGVERNELASLYPEFAPYLGLCVDGDCPHLSGKGCAVVEAVEKGEIDLRRYESYVRIYESCDERA